jgi:hypothetical protein
VHKYT